MCGINGFTMLDTFHEASDTLRAMNKRLIHRGPDEEGTKIMPFAAIGMRRLSIIDLAGGHQPISNEDESIWIVYNGEIYNYQELRKDMLKKGHVFKTHCDTEVIVHLYEEYGVDCVQHLNGIFAFAVVDLKENTLALARDHFGVKPLYYYITSTGDFIFSSEIASLLEYPLIPRKLCEKGLVAYLSHGFVPDPLTAIKGVFQIPPGSYLIWRQGRIKQKKYWSYSFQPNYNYTRESALEEFSFLLEDSIQRQLVSEVPLAIFLSGGIDSSTVAAFASRNSDTPIKTFSVRFPDKSYDESCYSRMVAKHLRSNHHEVTLPFSDFDLNILDLIIQHTGQPFADTSAIPTFLISKYVREQATVCLSGDGGDELFAGYDHTYWAAKMIRAKQNIPHFVRAIGYRITSLASMLPILCKKQLIRHARKGLEATLYDIPLILFRMRSYFQPEELYSLFAAKHYRGNIEDVMFDFIKSVCLDNKLQPEEIAISALINGSLHGDILTKVDRMSMANSLEVRVPLLDYRIGEFSGRLPFSLKSFQGERKYLLREVGRPYLPKEIYLHKKQGFSIPLFKWFNDDFWVLVEQYIGVRGCSPLKEIFDPRCLGAIIHQGKNAYEQEGIISHSYAAYRVWMLLVLAHWIEKFKIEF